MSIAKLVFYTWGIIVNEDLSLARPSLEISTPSILMLPPLPSMIRKSDRVKDDFPAPVRPTMPTLSVGLTEKLIPKI